MTIDKKIREIARVCATLSKSAPTAEEHDIFANLTLTWLSIALESRTGHGSGSSERCSCQ